MADEFGKKVPKTCWNMGLAQFDTKFGLTMPICHYHNIVIDY